MRFIDLRRRGLPARRSGALAEPGARRQRAREIALIVMLAVLVLSACGPQAATPTQLQPASPTAGIASPTSSPATPPGSSATAEPTNTTGTTTPQPEVVVRQFLDAVFGMGESTAPEDAAAKSLLSQQLRERLGNRPAISLIGVPGTPRNYTVSPSPSPEVSIPENAYVTALLDYETGALSVNFNLALNVAGSWEITDVQADVPAGEPERALSRFLDALFGLGEFDRADEQTARTLLSPELLQELGDRRVTTLLGVQDAPPSYTIEEIVPDVSIPENRYFAATLNYPGGAVGVDFTLSMLAGPWQITGIQPDAGGGQSAPDQLVWDFLNLVFGPGAGSAANEEQARALLAADLAGSLGDRPVQSLIGVPTAPLRYSVHRSAEPEVGVPETAYFDARLDYESVTEVRRFTLGLTNDGWRIENIQRVPDLGTPTPTR